jgi:hypothetical protein
MKGFVDTSVQKGAKLSADRRYRYGLWRIWEPGPIMVIVGLNPSKADEDKDDPTIRRCINFARDMEYGGIYMLNLFAYRATAPEEMMRAHYPVGEDNDDHIISVCEQLAKDGNKFKTVIAAWGGHGDYMGRDQEVCMMLACFKLMCLGTTKDGQFPRHPLFVSGDTKLQPYKLMEVI